MELQVEDGELACSVRLEMAHPPSSTKTARSMCDLLEAQPRQAQPGPCSRSCDTHCRRSTSMDSRWGVTQPRVALSTLHSLSHAAKSEEAMPQLVHSGRHTRPFPPAAVEMKGASLGGAHWRCPSTSTSRAERGAPDTHETDTETGTQPDTARQRDASHMHCTRPRVALQRLPLAACRRGSVYVHARD
jgi:hypothetical protein